MNRIARSTRTRGIGTVAGVLVVLAGCGGSGQSPEELFDRTVTSFDPVLELLEDIATALGDVNARSDADAVAERLHDDFIPRLDAIIDDWAAEAGSMTEEERQAVRGLIESDEAAQARLVALGVRADQFGQRLMQNVMEIERRGLVTPALESAMASLETASARFERTTSALFADGGDVGSAAWCQEMAGKPQAEWTMDEALAFANRCVGG